MVFERVVQQQVYDYLEQNKQLSQSQFGFRKGSSTQHAVTLFSDAIRQAMDTGMLTGAVFVDLSKAFDTVDHARLLSKLPIYGILNRELKWFESYLFNRNHFVSFHGVPSEVCSISCGVPQGSILGPLLFVLLINDLEFQLKYSQIILYADDAVIYFADKDISIIRERLNADLEYISNRFWDNNLKSKTECVLFGTHKKTARSENFVIKMNGTQITESHAYEYLGVIMDKNLNYLEHLNKIQKKGASRVRLLSRIRHNIGPYTAETIYKMMILLVMLYCSNIFIDLPNCHKLKFEDIQNRAMQIVYGSINSSEWPSINEIRNRNCVHEVFKCLPWTCTNAPSEEFHKSFNSHSQNTRGNNVNLSLPKVKTEAGRKRFAYQGTIIFNKLPNDLKTEQSLLRFKYTCKSINLDF